MKYIINELLKQNFLKEFNNAKLMREAEEKQKPFSKVYYSELSTGLLFVNEFANN